MSLMSGKFSSLPGEIYMLHILHNIGATSPERALTLEEIARWTAMDPLEAEINLRKLLKDRYISVEETLGVKRYFVTADGIRKVLSMYS